MECFPQLPQWAQWAGYPKPTPDESFYAYVTRLGLDPEPMLVGLTERTRCLANQRLASELMRQAPQYFRAYVDARKGLYVTPT